jgi:hypothetical protein
MGEQRITVADGEHEVVNVSLDRQFEPFALAITDCAVYIFELSRRSFTRNYHVQRLPLEQVVRVAVERTGFGVKMYWAATMIISGGALTFLMALTFVGGNGRGSVMLLPIALILGGLILPFTSRGHRTLRIEFAGRNPYVWKPSWFMADVTKQHVAYLIEKIVKAFRGLQVYVHEDDG